MFTHLWHPIDVCPVQYNWQIWSIACSSCPIRSFPSAKPSRRIGRNTQNLRLKTQFNGWSECNSRCFRKWNLPFSSCSYFLFAADWRNQIRFGVFSATPTTHVNQQMLKTIFRCSGSLLCTYRPKKKFNSIARRSPMLSAFDFFFLLLFCFHE